jgi:hypothetical protein
LVRALPVERVFPAHGPAFGGHAARVDELLRHHVERKDAIVARLRQSPCNGWEVAIALFGADRNALDKRLALQETLAHLQSLAVAGRVTKSVARERVLWAAA